MNLREMVKQLERMGIRDERVLRAIAAVDRKLFVPKDLQYAAYDDRPLPIGYGQTISQPYTVARMCELLIQGAEAQRRRGSKVLEIGTGSGWQTAILAHIFDYIYSVELISDLAREAEIRIQKSKIKNVNVRIGDGKEGWGENAPYDGIICAADASEIPAAWKEQLKVGGRIVCPVRGEMMRVTKKQSNKVTEYETETFGRYSFVPLV